MPEGESNIAGGAAASWSDSPWIGLATGAVNTAAGMFGQKKAYKYNKRLAAYTFEKNMELLKYQLDYNSPKSQMARYAEAGLNPNLIYGQGTPGNMESRPEYPQVKGPDYSFLANLGTQIAQSNLMAAQTDLTKVKTQESGVKQDLMRQQENVLKANPYLNEAYVNAMVTNIESIAKLKEQEANFMTQGQKYEGYTTQGEKKMYLQIEQMAQQYGLNDADQKLKAEILQSKKFQNELQKIQLDWMKNGDITPQHLYMGLMLLLQKLM